MIILLGNKNEHQWKLLLIQYVTDIARIYFACEKIPFDFLKGDIILS